MYSRGFAADEVACSKVILMGSPVSGIQVLLTWFMKSQYAWLADLQISSDWFPDGNGAEIC
jgi:hypothetical protein